MQIFLQLDDQINPADDGARTTGLIIMGRSVSFHTLGFRAQLHVVLVTIKSQAQGKSFENINDLIVVALGKSFKTEFHAGGPDMFVGGDLKTGVSLELFGLLFQQAAGLRVNDDVTVQSTHMQKFADAFHLAFVMNSVSETEIDA